MLNLDHIQKQITEAKFEDTSPLAYGWAYSHRNKEFGEPVFEQKGMQSMKWVDDAWLIQLPNGKIFSYEGTMQEITEDAKKELLK